MRLKNVDMLLNLLLIICMSQLGLAYGWSNREPIHRTLALRIKHAEVEVSVVPVDVGATEELTERKQDWLSDGSKVTWSQYDQSVFRLLAANTSQKKDNQAVVVDVKQKTVMWSAVNIHVASLYLVNRKKQNDDHSNPDN